MLTKLKENNACNVFDISNRNQIQINDIDFNSLVPDVESSSEYDIEKLKEYDRCQKETQGMDVLPLDLYNAMIHHCLFVKDYRSAFWLTTMANTGLRHSDVIKFRRADFIDSNGNIRDSILVQEKKTDKQRIVFVNKAIKETLLMLLWHSDISALDFLITSNANRKGYELETYVDDNGHTKAVRKNGRYVYKLDSNGNKIPKPLSRRQSENIMKEIIVNSLGVNLKNDWRCKNEPDAVKKICTHSLRKMYGKAVTDAFINQFDSNVMYAHTAAMRFLSQDYGHSSEAMTTRYSKDFDNIKKDIVMNMNLGIETIHPFFEEEMINYISGVYSSSKV